MITLTMVLSGISCYYLVDNRKNWNLKLQLAPTMSSVHVDD